MGYHVRCTMQNERHDLLSKTSNLQTSLNRGLFDPEMLKTLKSVSSPDQPQVILSCVPVSASQGCKPRRRLCRGWFECDLTQGRGGGGSQDTAAVRNIQGRHQHKTLMSLFIRRPMCNSYILHYIASLPHSTLSSCDPVTSFGEPRRELCTGH